MAAAWARPVVVEEQGRLETGNLPAGELGLGAGRRLPTGTRCCFGAEGALFGINSASSMARVD